MSYLNSVESNVLKVRPVTLFRITMKSGEKGGNGKKKKEEFKFSSPLNSLSFLTCRQRHSPELARMKICVIEKSSLLILL
jgi:hypothetical protein